jgi:hypothetical protein
MKRRRRPVRLLERVDGGTTAVLSTMPICSRGTTGSRQCPGTGSGQSRGRRGPREASGRRPLRTPAHARASRRGGGRRSGSARVGTARGAPRLGSGPVRFSSDGLVLSSVEALAMGALPIQSYTSCSDEWIRDGERGLIVPPDDPLAGAAAVRRAALDDALVDDAASLNSETVRARFDLPAVREQVIRIYERSAARA